MSTTDTTDAISAEVTSLGRRTLTGAQRAAFARYIEDRIRGW